MDRKRTINSWLKREVLLLDGAIGTELQERGMPAGVCPEIWCLENPAILQEIHRAYGRAGSQIVYTATFGANPCKLGQYKIDRTREINRELAILARRSVGRDALVGGSIGPTGLFVEPFGPLPFEEAVEAFKEQVRGLLEGGVDLFALETMIDIQEARAALLAVKELCAHYTIVTMTLEKNGRTLGGADPVTALITLQSLGADAVGCNCSAGPETMVGYIAAMKPYATVPLAAKPNAGMPILSEGKTIFPMTPGEFSFFARDLVAAGVNVLGGCCGTTPDHIRELKKGLAGLAPVSPLRTSLGALSSARRHQLIGLDKPLLIVGERINPTGKKDLQEELLAGKVSLVRKMARIQKADGADLLDVNIGVPGIDETRTLKQAISGIAISVDLPLVIDSSDPAAIEVALRVYPGRALINSISLEEGKITRILPLAARYGAMIIILPLTGEGIPKGAREREKIIGEIFARAREFGYAKSDIIVDALVMTVASNPELAGEALKVVRWCQDKFKCASLMGLTNVSFGMPGRPWLNSAYLAMAQAMGLTMVIANPASVELMQIKLAGDVLTNRDDKARAYIARLAGKSEEAKDVFPPTHTPQEKVFKAILEGNRDEIIPLINDALAAGAPAAELMDQVMMKAIGRVGELFEDKVFFLPQLIASAEAMKDGIGRLEGLLKDDRPSSDGGTIVLATVRGDIHDIGKNIVALLLRNAGHRVIDLGKDVPAGTIMAAIREHNPDLVGLSALMTTTMTGMKEIIEMARREGLRCPFVLGGAVVTPAYARSLDALYARDGVEAVRIIDRMMKE
ncbi:MAG: homocysteine S-methyltransferase family protein [Smithellaceae bacterium]|nr:homocysteine S-methyltransferase family protein [Smithellaceae bacterium]